MRCSQIIIMLLFSHDIERPRQQLFKYPENLFQHNNMSIFELSPICGQWLNLKYSVTNILSHKHEMHKKENPYSYQRYLRAEYTLFARSTSDTKTV